MLLCLVSRTVTHFGFVRGKPDRAQFSVCRSNVRCINIPCVAQRSMRRNAAFATCLQIMSRRLRERIGRKTEGARTIAALTYVFQRAQLPVGFLEVLREVRIEAQLIGTLNRFLLLKRLGRTCSKLLHTLLVRRMQFQKIRLVRLRHAHGEI